MKFGSVRLKITLSLPEQKAIEIPLHYNHLIQGILYRTLPQDISGTLHDQGYLYQKRRFRLFTFSQIFSENFCKINDSFLVELPCHFYFSSFDEKISKELFNNILKSNLLKI
ncbi:MAG: hypothetical protein ACK4NF_03245 [Planctomycetota bacterium]